MANKAAEQQADPELKALGDRVTQMVAAAMLVTDDWSQLWRDGYNYIFSNQLEDKERRDGWQRIQANQIWPAVMQEVSLMSQRKPKIVAQPVEDSDHESSQMWSAHLQYQYKHSLDMPSVLMDASMDNKVYGYSVAKVRWDAKHRWDADNGRWQGAPKVDIIRPDFFGADPEAENLDHAQYVVVRFRFPLKEAKAIWPKFADDLDNAARMNLSDDRDKRGSTGFFVTRDDDTGTGVRVSEADGRLVRLIRKEHRPEQPQRQGGLSMPTHVTIEEVYFRDVTEEDATEERAVPVDQLVEEGRAEMRDGQAINPATGQPFPSDEFPRETLRKFRRPKYPNGRFVVRAANVILNPKDEDQVWPYRHWPIVVGINSAIPHTWQGINSVEMPKQLQDWLNVGLAHILNYVRQYGDPVVMVEQGALAQDPQNRNLTAKLKSRAGAIWRLAKGAMSGANPKIRRDPPPPMSRGLLEFFNLVGAEIRNQTGVQEVALGRQSKGGTTATEVLRLETNTRLRIAMQAELMDHFIIRIMELVAELIQENMEVGDVVRIVGEDGRKAAEEVTQGVKDAQFDISLEVGTALPLDEERMKQDVVTAMELLGDSAAAMYPQMLRTFNIPNADEILERIPIIQKIREEEERAKIDAEMEQQLEQEKLAARQVKEGEGGEEEAPEPINLGEQLDSQAAADAAEALK